MQISYFYRTRGKTYKFSLCYQVLLGDKDFLETQDRIFVDVLNGYLIKNCLINHFTGIGVKFFSFPEIQQEKLTKLLRLNLQKPFLKFYKN